MVHLLVLLWISNSDAMLDKAAPFTQIHAGVFGIHNQNWVSCASATACSLLISCAFVNADRVPMHVGKSLRLAELSEGTATVGSPFESRFGKQAPA